MRKLLFCIVFFIIFLSCKKDSAELLTRRWNFVAMDMPKLENFLHAIDGENDDSKITMRKFFLGNKLILRKDSSFDMLLMKQYMHGKWEYNKQAHHLSLTDESAKKLHIVFGVDSVSGYSLKLDTDEFAIEKLAANHVQDNSIGNYLFRKAYYQFFLIADKDSYSSLSEDLYSKQNNDWRIKPVKPESSEQIKKRVLDHLVFWKLLFHDADRKKRNYISYKWFSSPLVIASNGVVLKFYNEVKQEWDQNFYDSVQAHYGYELMRKCFNRKIKYLQTDDKYKRNEDIIKQLISNFLDATSAQ